MEKITAGADRTDDPTEELGCRLSPAERVVRVYQKLDDLIWDGGPDSMELGLTDWEMDFLDSNSTSKWPNFRPKQEVAMAKIEAKVFNWVGDKQNES